MTKSCFAGDVQNKMMFEKAVPKGWCKESGYYYNSLVSKSKISSLWLTSMCRFLGQFMAGLIADVLLFLNPTPH